MYTTYIVSAIKSEGIIILYDFLIFSLSARMMQAHLLCLYFSACELRPILLQLTAHMTRLLDITHALSTLNLKMNTHYIHVVRTI